ncbi:hypothetical protein BU17DRAFT_67733 [Hysterangium stoloniferum]|nr:hypothetical protein BU17DRAFT_67733 [Hysterangium stoloniferum]
MATESALSNEAERRNALNAPKRGATMFDTSKSEHVLPSLESLALIMVELLDSFPQKGGRVDPHCHVWRIKDKPVVDQPPDTRNNRYDCLEDWCGAIPRVNNTFAIGAEERFQTKREPLSHRFRTSFQVRPSTTLFILQWLVWTTLKGKQHQMSALVWLEFPEGVSLKDMHSCKLLLRTLPSNIRCEKRKIQVFVENTGCPPATDVQLPKFSANSSSDTWCVDMGQKGYTPQGVRVNNAAHFSLV